jgi:anti-sigma regulatory factor (Ser/Thr protein kinase)
MAGSEGIPFSGEIVVASRIVDTLSSGLYETPAACLKELVNNSYDADAKQVKVHVKPDAALIIIEDDGQGMTRVDFERHFKRIAESHKRDESDTTDSGRAKIGKIGIGFIAANELCDVMEIESTVARSAELLRVRIDFKAMRTDPELRKRDDDAVKKGDYEGVVLTAQRHEHFTRVYLTSMTDNAREAMVATHGRADEAKAQSLYGLNPDSIADRIALGELASWDDLDMYSQTMLGVALNVPVRYPSKWVEPPFADELKDFEDAVAALGFEVLYDGTSLRKPLVLRHGSSRALVHCWEHKGKHVEAKGYFFAQQGAIKPIDVNGLLIRVRNAAVGSYDRSYLDFPSTTGPIFQDWISGEVWADDRLEAAMNIDRKTLRTTYPAYTELQKAVHRELRTAIQRCRKELWGAGSEERKAERMTAESQHLERILTTNKELIGTGGARELRQTWLKPAGSMTRRGREAKTSGPAKTADLLRKYTVAELYEICIDAASEVLSDRDLQTFISALTQRLQRR